MICDKLFARAKPPGAVQARGTRPTGRTWRVPREPAIGNEPPRADGSRREVSLSGLNARQPQEMARPGAELPSCGRGPEGGRAGSTALSTELAFLRGAGGVLRFGRLALDKGHQR